MFHPSLHITPARRKALMQAGITGDQDLLDFVPRRYLDRNSFSQIGILRGQEETTVAGKVIKSETVTRGKRRFEAIISDQTGELKCVWFKATGYFSKVMKKGTMVAAFGKTARFGRYVSMAHPDIDFLTNTDQSLKTLGTLPVYPGNQFFKKTYITNPVLQQWAVSLLDNIQLEEFLPKDLLDELRLPERHQAYRMVHQPESVKEAERGLFRLKYEELLLFELAVHYLKLRKSRSVSRITIPGPGPLTKKFFSEILTFKLTEGQRNALRDIKTDLQSGVQMNRLLQGDVGSGKTVVAVGAILMMLDHGYQTAFMAPTEVLAEQHFRTLSAYLEPLGIDIRLLTGKRTSKQKREILEQLASGTTQVVVGTHAIIQDSVKFKNVGLVVIDEQHRFGVVQRAHFQKGDDAPHVLNMSATPIPRSLAMTVFGKLDISVISELPSGRKPIRTAIRGESKRKDVYSFLRSVLREGGQAYIVFPLVEESEAMDLKNAVNGFEQIQAAFPEFQAGLLHGKMKPDEKESVMKAFESGAVSILVSTTVIEVGINVPNASVMIIEDAERFGLSQLHQLRGRIGRGSRQSYCILMPGVKQTKTARERLQTMVESNDGFHIAETDLRLRGPGDFLGTRQSGLPEFRFADLVEDEALLRKAASTAAAMLNESPELDKPGLEKLKSRFFSYLKEKKEFFDMM